MILKSLIMAFGMYSKIPVPRVEWDKESMKYVFCFFPLIGIAAGGAIFLCAVITEKIGMGKILFSALMTVIPLIITGGIHFDGFLDTIDGICSYADKEKRRKILKDPNSGAFAVTGGLIYFALSMGFWSEIEAASETGMKKLLLICIGYCISRSLSGLSVITFPHGNNTGLAASFGVNAEKRSVIAVLILYIAAEIIGVLAVDVKGGAAVIAAAAASYGYHYYNCIKNFGGISGDLAGFFLQVCELMILGCISLI